MSAHLLQTLNAAKAQDEALKELTQEGAGRELQETDELTLKQIEVVAKESKLSDDSENDMVNDFQQARNVTYACQELMLGLLGDATKLAITTENPRAYDIVNNLVTNVRGLNKDLLDFNKMAIDNKAQTAPPADGETKVTVSEGGDVTVQRGNKISTSEMLRRIEIARKEKGEIETLDNSELLDGEFKEVDNGQSTEEG